MLGFWPMKAVLLLAMMFALSCSHFKTPDYADQGGEFGSPIEEYATADEYFSSQETKQFHKSTIRGPFQLYWPVDNPIVNRGYLNGGSKRAHYGLDLKGRRNDPIYAAHDGIVVYVGKKFRGYGKMVLIEYDNNWASLYSHLNSYKVVMGQEVKGGQLIGKMGRTGRATGVHLHFELIKNKKPIDPLPILKDSAIIRDVAQDRPSKKVR